MMKWVYSALVMGMISSSIAFNPDSQAATPKPKPSPVPKIPLQTYIDRLTEDQMSDLFLWNFKNTGQKVPPSINTTKSPDANTLANSNVKGSGLPGADISLTEARDIQLDCSSVLVAVIDTGVYYTHPDLEGSIWNNTAEAQGMSEVDDDENGLLDDAIGWNFVQDNANPMDDNGHGTHIAGVIGATQGNGIGVAGICGKASMVPIKVLDAKGKGTGSDVVEALYYAKILGAKVVNASWDYTLPKKIVHDPIREAILALEESGILVVTAAGNKKTNIDVKPSYPSAYRFSNIISVAATDNLDVLAKFSNFGPNTVHLAAPGTNIMSTFFPNPATKIPAMYKSLNGTSMATPHVAGAAALAWSFRPNLRYQDIKDAILRGVDQLPQLSTTTQSGGKLNIVNTIYEIQSQ